MNFHQQQLYQAVDAAQARHLLTVCHYMAGIGWIFPLLAWLVISKYVALVLLCGWLSIAGALLTAAIRFDMTHAPLLHAAKEANVVVTSSVFKKYESERAFGDITKARQLSLVFIGAGRVGSRITRNLASISGKATIIDHDLVQPENTVLNLTPYTPRDIPWPKAEALKRHLKASYDHLFIETHLRKLGQQDFGWLKALFSKSHYVVLALDDPQGLEVCVRAAYAAETPTAFPALHEGGVRGHIAVSSKNAPCIRCALGMESFDGLYSIPNARITSSDFDMISAAASMIIGQELMGTDSLFKNVHRPGANLVLVETRFSGQLENPRWIYRSMPKRKSCDVCNRQ